MIHGLIIYVYWKVKEIFQRFEKPMKKRSHRFHQFKYVLSILYRNMRSVCLQEKRYWRRYIYLWINYALFEELEAEDIERTREVFKACLNLIPHKKFTFAKIWLYYAQFEIRQKELATVRKVLVKILLLSDSSVSFYPIGNSDWNVS